MRSSRGWSRLATGSTRPIEGGRDVGGASGDRPGGISLVARRGTEATVLVHAAEDIIQQAISREGFRKMEQMQRCQAPIDPVDAQVLRQVVFEFIFALWRRQRQSDHGRWLLMEQTVSRLWM